MGYIRSPHKSDYSYIELFSFVTPFVLFSLSVYILFDMFLPGFFPSPGSHQFPNFLSPHSFCHPSFPHPPCLSRGGLFIGSVSGRRLCLSCVPSRMHPSNTHTRTHTVGPFFSKRWRTHERRNKEVASKRELTLI